MDEFIVIDRTHGACRDCDESQREAVKYAISKKLNGATYSIERATPKGTIRQHVVMVKRGR